MRFLCIILVFIAGSASAMQSTGVTQIFNDPTPVSQALSRGDVAALRRLRQENQNPVVQRMAWAAERRVLLDLPGTLEASRDCLKIAEKNLHVSGLTVCGLLEASAEAAAGNLPEWAKLTMSTRDRVHALAAQRGKALGNVNVFSLVPDYAPLINRPVPQVMQLVPGRIPLHTGAVTVTASDWHNGGQVAYPNMANLRIDGKTTEVLVDTGSAQTTLRSSAVSAPPFMDWLLLAGIFGTSSSRSSLTQPAKLQFGSLIINDPFVATNDQIPVNILGLDVLSQLGRIIITSNHVDVLAPAMPGIECSSPLFSASDLPGTTRLPRMFIEIDGERQEVMIDTGRSGELVKTLPAGSVLPTGEVEHGVLQGIQGQQHRISVSKSVAVLTSGAAGQLTMSASVGNQPGNSQYVLGGDSLRKISLYLDFIGNKACLMPLATQQSAQ